MMHGEFQNIVSKKITEMGWTISDLYGMIIQLEARIKALEKKDKEEI